MVRFLLDDAVVTLDAADPTGTVLDLLRYRLKRTGTKEGCGEGDCGACTVLVGTLADEDHVVWRAVNACILFVPMIDGKAVRTVESLTRGGGDLHPVQRELVERHGSQCGFCTPGFVMSLHARSIGAEGTRGVPVADVIAGNLCRCTGYGPILAAGEAVPVAVPDDSALVPRLRALRGGDDAGDYADPLAGQERRWHRPASVGALAELLIAKPEARIVAGATDVGLWVTKQQRVLEEVVFIGDIPELRAIAESDAGVTLGAAVRYAEAWGPLGRLHPDLGELVRRIGGTQVRNAGTVGGNIANGSPIGDMPPALIALDAVLTLRRGDARRTVAIADYFIAYGKQDRRPGEFLESVFVPRPDPATRIAITKLSKRFDSDISAVCGAFAVTVEQGRVTAARIAFGGMAATPRRAPACEAALVGQDWSRASVERAMAAMADDYAPIDDVRGSGAYRMRVAANLLKRMWLAEGGVAVSVLADV